MEGTHVPVVEESGAAWRLDMVTRYALSVIKVKARSSGTTPFLEEKELDLEKTRRNAYNRSFELQRMICCPRGWQSCPHLESPIMTKEDSS